MPAEPVAEVNRTVDATRPLIATALSERLRAEFGDTIAIHGGPVPPAARLAVRVAVGLRVEVVEFARWARAARLPAVVVELHGATAFVGPLATPGRPGCAECARTRRLAAAAASGQALSPDGRVPGTEGAPPGPGVVGRAAAEVVGGSRVPGVVGRTDVGGLPGPEGAPRGVERAGRGVEGGSPGVARAVSGTEAGVAGQAGGRDGVARGVDVDRVVELLRDGGRGLLDHLAEVVQGRTVWHRVIPLPTCAVCGGADGIGTVGLPTGDDPAELLEALAGWVDPLTGVIPWITLRQPLGEGPGLPYVAGAAPPHRLGADGVPVPSPIGWGKGTTRCTAIISAVGEAIERYAPSIPDAARLVWARPADLDGEVLDPREFALYEPEQYAADGFGLVPFDRRVDHPWVRGSWLGTEQPVWVPAVFSYLALTVLPEHLICQGTSNGLAAGGDADSATARATLELVERDAMMAAWLTGAKGRYVELDDTLDDDLRAIVAALTERGPTVEVYLLPTSTYGTTAAALAIGDGRRWPGAVLGLGADRSPRGAIRTALVELAQTAPHLAVLLRERAHPVPPHADAVREMLDHAAYYFPPHRVAAFDRLRCGGTSQLRDLVEPIPEVSVEDLADVLGAAGIRVAVVDVTSADVAMGPFRVVRAVSPDLQGISYGHGYDRSPVGRLRSALVPPNRRNVHPIW
ncbi:YcaO-like family protein [Actinokineospora sp.]|uniref:YcaO-like family protein n=1 Tax=Actinokineospora sp. TaxID=1872133 RepID=UPI004037C4C4